MASPYLLVSNVNPLPVLGVNLPMILIITLEGTGRDLIANRAQSCKETHVVALPRTDRFTQEEKQLLPPPWGGCAGEEGIGLHVPVDLKQSY